MKKCHVCAQAAVYHVTVINSGTPKELHFCEQHFRSYMQDGTETVADAQDEENLLSKIAEEQEPDEADELKCPNCGITYRQFREQGRFGCAHDYLVFEEQLIPLLRNIHMQTEHQGKHPKRVSIDSQSQLKIVQLRRQLTDAIDMEDYETAANLRDQIAALESQDPQSQLESETEE